MRGLRAPIPAACGRETTPRNHAKPMAYVAKCDHRMMQQGGLARGAGLSSTFNRTSECRRIPKARIAGPPRS